MTDANASPGAVVVVKIGGEVARSALLGTLAQDLAELARRGVPALLVHGGGPQATELQKRLGQEPVIVAGRRVTDDATLEVMKMVVAGAINVDVCRALLAAGLRPVGLHGASSAVVRATRRPAKVLAGAGPEPVDLGHVGDVVGVDGALLGLLLGAGHTPVLACLGASPEGDVFNINADAVASAVASLLGARALIMVTDVRAVLRDVADAASRIPRVTRAEGHELIAQGVVSKGMVPKVEEAMGAVARGVRAVHVVGKLAPGELLREVEQPGAVGTVFVA